VTPSEVDRMGSYRAFVHPDGEYLSIGFEDTNDTLLKMPVGWRDRERVVAWVEAVNNSRGAVEDRDKLAAYLRWRLAPAGPAPVPMDELVALLNRLGGQ
jgi:hypothetical protein